MVRLQALIFHRLFEPSRVEAPVATAVICTTVLYVCRVLLLDSAGNARTSDRLFGALVRAPLWTWLVLPAGCVLLEFGCELVPLWLARMAGLRAFGPRFSPLTGATASITYTKGLATVAQARIMLARPGARLLVAAVACSLLWLTGSGLVGCLALLASVRSAGLLVALEDDPVFAVPTADRGAAVRTDAQTRAIRQINVLFVLSCAVVAAVVVHP
jgi:hypothetical protein